MTHDDTRAGIGPDNTRDTARPRATPVDRFDPRCDLCEAARFTHWYHEDDVCWIADCEVCLVPMVVWKPHGTDPTGEAVEHMLAALDDAARSRFGSTPFSIDRDMRQIPEHWHAHARDADWLTRRAHRPLVRYSEVGAQRVEP